MFDFNEIIFVYRFYKVIELTEKYIYTVCL